MNRKDFYIGIVIITVGLALGLYLHAKISSDRADQATAAQAAKDAATIAAQNATIIKNSQAADAAQVAQTKTQIVYLKAQEAAPVTPVDYDKIDQMIQQHTGVTAVTTTNPTTNAPQTTTDTVALRNTLLECDATKLALTSCQSSVAARDTQITALQSTNAAKNTQIATDEKIIKGGTFKHRFVVGLKHGACGGAGALAGIFTAKSQGTGTSAAVGAGAYTACELLINVKK